MSKKTADTQPDCDQPITGLLSVTEARQRILDSVTPTKGQEKLAIRESLERVLSTDILSTLNVPPHDNSAMDGYAIKYQDIPQSGQFDLKLAGTAFAGKPFTGKLAAGQAIRIMTGAVIPDGADTVVMQEHVERNGETVTLSVGHQKGNHIRHIGEDMKIGQTVLEKGQWVTPAELGLMASLGIAEVAVNRKCRVAFFSTGDELRSIGEPLEAGQIYDSNRYTLYGMLKRMNVDIIDMGVIADKREAIRQAFQTAANIADVVLTSGGVSVGDADYVKETLEELGEINFWRVAMKPGKPLAIGRINNAAFFGVPGNPVSAMTTFYQFVKPALEKMMGITPTFALTLKVPCMAKLKKNAGRLEYQRGILTCNNEGEPVVDSSGVQGSHIMTSMSRANCFIILPAGNAGVDPGDLVEVQPFAGLI
ncbi:MAG TPA: molybdopterin molybdenumtransferase MoeA [Gammaproteobacteria bacterium]|nr:molybdopterin molybdenumtransferase MoeA [Gammaproteobacteria bacterium]